MKRQIITLLSLLLLACNSNQSITYGTIINIHYKSTFYHKVAIDVSNRHSSYTFLMDIDTTTINTLNGLMLSETQIQVFYHKDISELFIKGKYTGTVDSISHK